MLLTIKEVASRLRISVSLAYRLVAKGEIPCHDIASCIRVDERELEKYLERQRRDLARLPIDAGRHF